MLLEEAGPECPVGWGHRRRVQSSQPPNTNVGSRGTRRCARPSGKSWPRGRLLTVLEVGGAEGLVRDTISWMANRSLSRCRALLIPISRWISVSDKADMMAPLLTLARQAATYQAGIPTQSCRHRT